MTNFNKYFDHTLLKPDAKATDVKAVIDEAIKYNTASVCINGCHVKNAKKYMDSKHKDNVKICAVAGFPLGAAATDVKAFEIKQLIEAGASEIDVVINIGAVKDGNWSYVSNEFYTFTGLCHSFNAGGEPVIIKFILETCLLSDEEIVRLCRIAAAAGADFVKTSTGFSSGGATEHAVRLMKDTVGDKVRVKASGGIRDLTGALAMIDSGADRLGCSASVTIIEEYNKGR